jgi:AraC-like DNA-binding protein
LRRRVGPGDFWHARIAVPKDLAHLIEHFWFVHWKIPDGIENTQETLPHPNVHVVFEGRNAEVSGLHSGRFVRVLRGEGSVFGIKFRPGGFRPFHGEPIAQLADRTVPLRQVFSKAALELQKAVAAARTDRAKMQIAARFFRERLPPHDPSIDIASRIVASVVDDRTLVSMTALAERHGLSARALQRLFKEYVGVGPKWVINRYRLHEAAERLASEPSLKWAEVALELGYFDQAHFIRDFKKLVGRTPASFAREESGDEL